MNKKLVALVLAVDVIAGVTLGSLVGYRQSSQQATATSKPATVQTEKKKEPVSVSPPVDAAATVAAAAPATDETSSDLPPKVENSMGNQIDMTEIEVAEVEKMLSIAGVPKDKKYSQRIMYFQKNNNISASGILDQQTLETLIHQATQKFVDQRIGTGQ